ncbi:MAG: hypothetical protein QF660_01110 [Anaerolineales bacterium]|jgi:4-amino-4-deoxy-L-arabinose transferase-like glycosyltransferase|nr:hypothetical protein [Anaerolineales bacterium]
MRKTFPEVLQLITVLVFAGILRMAYPGFSEFKADEARLYQLAYELASGKQIPLQGIGSSIGLPNFPLSTWIYALPIWLWRHPYAPTFFTGLLNTFAVLSCWLFARRYWGVRTATLSAFFFAVSPWAVIFSRKIWAQNLLPLFALGWAITAVITFTAGRRRAALCHGLLLGIIPQIHFSGLALLPISIVTAIICRRRVAWKWLAAGAAISTVVALPLAFHLGTHGMATLSSVTTLPTQFSANPMVYTWMLSAGTNIHSLAGSHAQIDYLQTAPNLSPVHWLWGGLVAFGSWQILRSGYSPKTLPALLLVAWLFVPAMLLLLIPLPVYPHYFIITFPAQYIIAALGAGTLFNKMRSPLFRRTTRAIILATAGLQIWALIALFQYLSVHTTPGGFGTPLALKLTAVEAIRTAMRARPATEVMIVGRGNDPSVHQFPAVYDALLHDIPHRFIDGSATAVRTTNHALALLQTENQPSHQHYLDWSTRVTSIPLRIGDDPLKVMEIPPLTTEIFPHTEFSPPNTLANGVKLLGYKPFDVQDTLRWELHWHVGATTEENYHFYNHLLDTTGKRVGQADLAAFAANQWHDGDRVISFFSTPLTDRHEILRVGMYTYPEMENVPVVDLSGRVIGHDVNAQWLFP